MVSNRRILSLVVLVVLVALFAVPASAQHTNTTPITITDCPNPCPNTGQVASLYPSTITVSGETGVVQRVSVTLFGFSHGYPDDVDFLLVSPSGRKSVILSDFGGGPTAVSNIDVTLDDYAERPVPSTVIGNTGVPFVTGTYRPANSNTSDLFPGSAPGGPYTYTLSAFNGDTPNGTWSLYIIDDANLDGGSISGGWSITFGVRPPPPAAGDILITEFRTRGVGTTPPGSDGSADEFIELYNNTNSTITIIDSVPGADPTSVAGAGWRIAGAQGAAETTFRFLPQTMSTAGPLALAPRGYFLITTQPGGPNPAGNTYSLTAYPTGTALTTSGATNMPVNPTSALVGFLPDDVGLAIFSTADAVSAARLDSVGFSSVTLADYKEGTGLAPAGGIVTPSQHSWTRRLIAGVPQDTGDNAADFLLVATTGDVIDGQAATLGAPGPERSQTMTSFTISGAPSHYPPGAMTSALIDLAQAKDAAPNLVRDLTPVANGANGTLKFRRRYTNNTGEALVSLRFRVVALSTRTGGAAPAGQADLRVLDSPAQTITLTDASTVTTLPLTLQTPAAQPSGGGVNSSLSVVGIQTTAPLANGASVVVEFNLGVETVGPYVVVIRGEGLTADGIGGVNVLDQFTTGADLAITKTDSTASVVAGGSTTYTIVASNSGPGGATGATVTDTLPSSLTCTWTCVGASGGTCTAAGSGNISDTVNLPSGGSVIYTASCAIAPGATGTLSNTATVAVPAGMTDPNPANNSATDTDTLVASADLAITKTDGVTTATPGGSVTYTITASNAGLSNATGATVADTFPASLTCTWTCVGAGGGTCTAAGSGNINGTVNLPAGGSVTYTASCTIAASATGTLSNTATISAQAGVTDPNPANNSATDTDALVASADLAITKTDGATTATPGGSVIYTIVASNAGPSTAANATVADMFPASLTCSWTCVGAGGGTCTAAGSGNINGTVNLPAGGSVTYTASCAIAASATGTLTNTATVTAPAGVTDPNPGNNSATDTDTLTMSADLVITKTDGVTTATPGGSVTYTIVASNAGPSTAANATVADIFPAPLTCSWTCVGAGGGTCTAAGSGNINGPVILPAGSSVTYTASCTIAASASGSLSNTATISAPAGVTDPNPGNNSATDTDTLTSSRRGCDVNGDGREEIVTAAGPGGGPHVRVFSPSTGTELASFFPADAGFRGGVSVACGDVDGDGLGDIITTAGAGGEPLVRVLSLASGVPTEVVSFFAYHPAFTGGVRIAVGDVTGDGGAEIITAAGAGGGPHVRAFSLVGGLSEVASFFAYAPTFDGGVSVVVGDVTGDGVAEIITGAGAGGGPHVRAFSLAGGGPSEVASFFAYDPRFTGGVSVAAGDVTGDGVADIITGAGAGGGPHVRAFSLAGGGPSEVASFFAYDPRFMGGVFVAAGDVTGDGVADIITGAGPGGGPHVRVFDGMTGEEVASFFAYDPSFTGGVFVGAGI